MFFSLVKKKQKSYSQVIRMRSKLKYFFMAPKLGKNSALGFKRMIKVTEQKPTG